METLECFAAGQCRASAAVEALPIADPTSGDAISEVPLSLADEIAGTAEAGLKAFAELGRRPAGKRVHSLVKLKALLEDRRTLPPAIDCPLLSVCVASAL